MNSSFERLEDNKVKFEVTIDADEVDLEIDSIYKQVNKTSRIPGFRKGKAPKTVLEHNFGAEYFTSQATVNLIEKHSPEAVDKADMVALGQYKYEDEESLVKKGEDYSYSFTIVVKPVLELSSTDPVEVELPAPVATEKEINAQIDLLRSYYIDLETVTDRPVKNDDIIVYSQSCEINGEPIEEGKEQSTTHVVGSSTSNSSKFDEELIGMSIGEEKKITLPSSEFGLGEEYPMVQITAKVSVEEITAKVMPELTDEWVQKTSEAENVEGLRKQIGESIAAEKESRLDRNKSIECLEALAARLEGEPSDEMIQDAQTTALRNLYINLSDQGISLDQYLKITGRDSREFAEDMQRQGVELAKQELALDALARSLELEVSEEDIDKAFEDVADDPQTARKEWEADHKMALLKEQILRDKAAKWLYENAKVSYTVVEDEDEDEGEGEDAAAAEDAADNDAAVAEDAAEAETAAEANSNEAEE